jgi:hypothetical protein
MPNANRTLARRAAKPEESVAIWNFIVNLACVMPTAATSVLQQRNTRKTSIVGISRHFIHFQVFFG